MAKNHEPKPPPNRLPRSIQSKFFLLLFGLLLPVLAVQIYICSERFQTRHAEGLIPILVTLAAFAAAFVLCRRIFTAVVVFDDITELLQARKALSESEDKYRRLVEIMPAATYTCDTDGVITFYNKLAAELWGRSPRAGNSEEKFCGSLRLYRPDGTHLPHSEIPMAEAIRKGKSTRNEEVVIERPDGSRINVSLNIDPLFSGSGEITGAVNVFVDVTRQKQIEEALRLSEEKFALAFANNPAAISMTRLEDGLFLEVNDTWVAVTGYGREEAVGHRSVDLGAWPSSEARSRFVRELREKGFVRGWEWESKRKSGETYVAEASAQVLTVQGERVILTTLVDITERKRLEQAFQFAFAKAEEGSRLLQTLMEQVPGGIALIGGPPDFALKAVSRHGLEMIGWPADTLMAPSSGFRQEPWNLSVAGGVSGPKPEQMPLFRAHRFGWTVRNREMVLETPDGRKIDLLVDAVPVLDGQGYIIGAINCWRDITERKQMEDDLRRSESEFKLLSRTASRLLSENPQEIVNQLCRDVMAHLDCHVFFNFLVEESAGKLRLNAYSGITEEEAGKIEWLDFGEAVCGYSAREAERIIAEDIFNAVDTRTDLVRSYGIQAYACHPLKAGNKVIGTLSFGTKTRAGFSHREISVMKTVADQVAVAMERIRSHDQLELRVQERTAELEKANSELRQIPSKLIESQEKERKRLASELHDSIGQTLSALKFRMEYILNALRKEDAGETPLKAVEDFIPTLQRSIDETRAIYMGLRPKVLEDFGVIPALLWLREEMLRLYPERHIEIDIRVKEYEIPRHLHIPIFRIAQEALNNVARHSRAEWVDVSLALEAVGVELVISDDGVGMDVDEILRSSTARSLGLTGMKERAEMFGGRFTIESALGEGTTIRCVLPVRNLEA